MDEMMVIVFDSEIKAYESSNALQDLQNEGCINLYSKAVVVRDANGQVSVKQQGDGGPVGTLVGLLAGGLLSLPLGPLGVALGAGAGTAGGLGYDLAHLGSSQDYLQDIEDYLKPGKAAIVAEVFKEWTEPVDARMKALDGYVFRYPYSEILDAQIQGLFAPLEANFARLEVETKQATGEARVKLQKQLDAARDRLQAEQDAIQAEIEANQKETEAKVKSLQEQADKASEEQKAEYEKHIAEVQAAHKRRSDLLKQAWELIKKALSA